ncbi:MAG: hypothetical protein IPP97_22230 [Candidatus Obscuribacter sp.]|nr:hypothetical protein [Candidatus Obscuribacter sp.]
MTTCIRVLKLTPRQLIGATLLSALALVSIGVSFKHFVRMHHCAPVVCGRSLPADLESGKKFVQWFTENAIDYKQDMASHENYLRGWADPRAAEKIDKIFAIKDYCNNNSVDFVPAYFWPSEIQKDGTLKVGIKGDLINSGQQKIKSLRLKLIYTVRRDQAGYRIQKVKLQYIKARDIQEFLQPTSNQEPTSHNALAVLHFKWGQHNMLREQYSSAKHCFTAAIEQNPDFASAYTMRADAENKLKDLDSARADLDKAIAIAPEEWPSYFNRAILSSEYSIHDFEDYSRVTALCPGYPCAYINRARMQEQYGTRQRALDDYNKFIALEPHYSYGYSSKADLELRTGSLLGAYLDCNKAIELDPQNGRAYFTRGQLRQKFFDQGGAMQDFKKASSLPSLY